MFCPRCGIQRTGRVCEGCGYDYVEGAKTPAITLSRGINWMSVLFGLVALAGLGFVAWVVFFFVT